MSGKVVEREEKIVGGSWKLGLFSRGALRKPQLVRDVV